MLKYEVMVILDAALEEAQKESTIEAVKGWRSIQCRCLGNQKTGLSDSEEERRILRSN